MLAILFQEKNKTKMLVFPKNAEKNASTIEKGLLAARKRCDFRLLLHFSNSIFWGFPLSRMSGVLPSANKTVNAFFCFVLSPIVAVAKTQLFRPTLSKPGCESNILVTFF